MLLFNSNQIYIWEEITNLNTSHVIVQLQTQNQITKIYIDLNTSHVIVQRGNGRSNATSVNKFKYISCYCSTPKRINFYLIFQI